MKWFFCGTDHMIGSYFDCMKVALYTALRTGELEPHFVYDGPDRPEVAWLAAQGVTIHRHTLSFIGRLYDFYSPLSEDCCHLCVDKFQVARGAFLRCEIPLLCDDPYVLYTDVDVIFTGQRLKLGKYTPEFFCAAPETVHEDNFNAGVMLMNTAGVRSLLPTLTNYLDADYDQSALRGAVARRQSFFDKSYNWRAYWPRRADAKIIHFHGPKPGWDGKPPTASLETLAPLTNAHFRDAESHWLAIQETIG